MEYLHTMIRVSDLDESLDFFCGKLGLVEVARTEVEAATRNARVSTRRRRSS